MIRGSENDVRPRVVPTTRRVMVRCQRAYRRPAESHLVPLLLRDQTFGRCERLLEVFPTFRGWRSESKTRAGTRAGHSRFTSRGRTERKMRPNNGEHDHTCARHGGKRAYGDDAPWPAHQRNLRVLTAR